MNALHHQMNRSQTPWYDEDLTEEQYRARCVEIRNAQLKLKDAREKYEQKGLKCLLRVGRN
jgi:hypothetical protein